jgi:hypothetical protein
MSEAPVTNQKPDESDFYEIRIKGHLDDRWAEGFEGLSLTRESDGTTLLSGLVADQAALHGVLKRIRDLGLPLVSVIRAETARPGGPIIKP